MKSIIELQDITKQYNGQIVFENLSLSVYEKQIVALVGKNSFRKKYYVKNGRWLHKAGQR